MARMEQAIKNIVDMFMEYADGDGKLSKEEFMKLIDTEIEDPEMKEKINEANLKKVLKKRDRNHDGQLNFKEFSAVVLFVVKRYYGKKGGKGHEEEDEEATE